jgi:flavorubredoxin
LASYHVDEVVPGVYLLRVNDRATRFFEALWEIPEGITYNAYLVRSPGGDVLIDTWKKAYAGLLLDALEELTGPERLRYVVVQHMEPDHSGALEDVLRWAPGARVLGHPLAGGMMREAYPRAGERFRPLRDGERLPLEGLEAVFIHTPWLHWPETSMTWLPGPGVLFTGDVFGGYGVPRGLYDDECVDRERMLREMRKYVVTVIGHYREWILRGLGKLEKLQVRPRVIAPAHGLVWRRSVGDVVEEYRRLGEARPREGKVTLVYASMYGTVERLARAVECRLARLGYRVAVYGFTDTTRPPLSEILVDVADSEALVVATPTYEVEPFPLLRYLVEEVCWKTGGSGRPAYILASYGWGGRAAEALAERLRGCGYQPAVVLKHRAVGPGAVSWEQAREAADRLASLLRGGGGA